MNIRKKIVRIEAQKFLFKKVIKFLDEKKSIFVNKLGKINDIDSR